MNHATRTITTPTEALAVCAISFGWAIYGSTVSMLATAHGTGTSSGTAAFSDLSFQWTIIWEIIFASAALIFLRLRGFAIGALYQAPSATGALIGIALYAGSCVANWLLLSPFVQQLETQPITAMITQARFTAHWLVGMAIVNGLYEEAFLLGFLARGLRQHGRVLAISVSLLVCVLYHGYQGGFGMLAVLAFGLVLSLYFAYTDKLYPAVFAHVIADIVPFAH